MRIFFDAKKKIYIRKKIRSDEEIEREKDEVYRPNEYNFFFTKTITTGTSAGFSKFPFAEIRFVYTGPKAFYVHALRFLCIFFIL